MDRRGADRARGLAGLACGAGSGACPAKVRPIWPQRPRRGSRLAYDELFAHQLTLALARQSVQRGKGRARRRRRAACSARCWRPCRTARPARRSARSAKSRPTWPRTERMNRLLQGDVGSGKTLVALMALLVAVEAGGQGVMMAPTEILARQHLDGLQPLAEKRGRGAGTPDRPRQGGRAARRSWRRWRTGDIHILVGTHAVFQKDVAFHDLRLAVIDEQHRFGVAQRMELGAKGDVADVLVMTATPIPRSRWPGAIRRHGCLGSGRKAARTDAGHDRAGLHRTRSTRWSIICSRRWPRGGRPTGSARWSRKARSAT